MKVPNAQKLKLRFDHFRIETELSSLIPYFQPYHHPINIGAISMLPLKSPGGLPDSLDYRPKNESFQLTYFLDKMPYLKSVIENLPFPVQSVRVMLMQPLSGLKLHVDGLRNFKAGLVRLQIPVLLDRKSYLSFKSEAIAAKPGELWYLDVSRPHSVFNSGKTNRITILIDALLSESLIAQFPLKFRSAILRRASIHRHPNKILNGDFRRYECEFRIPKDFDFLQHPIPAGALARIKVHGNNQILLQVPSCNLSYALTPFTEERLKILELGPGFSLRIGRPTGKSASIVFTQKGASEAIPIAPRIRIKTKTKRILLTKFARA